MKEVLVIFCKTFWTFLTLWYVILHVTLNTRIKTYSMNKHTLLRIYFILCYLILYLYLYFCKYFIIILLSFFILFILHVQYFVNNSQRVNKHTSFSIFYYIVSVFLYILQVPYLVNKNK